MVVSLHDITIGDDIELKRILAKAGFDGDMAKALLRKPQIAEAWVANLREQLNPPVPTFDQLFQSPEQIHQAFIARVKQQGWNFSVAECNALYDAMPKGFVSKLDSVLTLEIWLGDLPTTFEELWGWNVAVHGANGTWRWDGVKSDKKHLRLLKPKRYGSQPSVKWVSLDLTANRGKAPKDVRGSDSAGLELLSAATLHPDWPKAINYDTIPGVNLGGLEATVPGEDAWQDVPCLDWDRYGRAVGLSASWADGAIPDYSVPVVGEL